MNADKQYTLELMEHLLAFEMPDEMEQALRALLTPAEFSEVIKRLQIFKIPQGQSKFIVTMWNSYSDPNMLLI